MGGSIKCRLIPAPRGTGLVAAKIPKKVLGYAGIDDCFSSSRGATSTGGNFVKAVFAAVKATYGYNFPDLWEQTDLQVKKPPGVHRLPQDCRDQGTSCQDHLLSVLLYAATAFGVK